MAAVDAVALLAVVSALAFLVTPYVRMVAAEVGGLVSDLEAAGGAVVVLRAVRRGGPRGRRSRAWPVLVPWEPLGATGPEVAESPGAAGLRKAVEFDIQLETEKCVRGQQQRLLPLPGGTRRASRGRRGAPRPARRRAPRARGGAQEDGAAQRPHRAHLPLAVRVPQGEDGGLGRQEGAPDQEVGSRLLPWP
ncbi:hypothetical protein OsJ_19006 [Oryza sativa Japonica Group]|uniref:Uncharacterized protein n=1 Tax=Oryza sativa subsp. japonica TaxID=39947 RepID=B9FJZ3_ORYSJ|nr:hypothetical protein OsJ_19006 [Oryza sativa Japonica Group]